MFFVPKMVLLEKLTGDVWANTVFPASFEGFCSCFVSPFFLILAFCFVGFSCFGFLIYFFLLLFHTSSFYVLVTVSVVLGFLGFIMCYLLDLCFGFWFWFFFWGFKGQVRWPKGPPHLALNPPYLLYFVWFVLFLFVIFLQGLRVKWGCPKGDLTWP